MIKTRNILRKLSIETWERIRFTRTRFGLKIFETTITQNLLYKLAKSKTKYKVRLFEAVDENTNGNDIEMFVRTKNGYLFFPTQAKILHKKLNYPKMEHGNQINNLISYSNLYGSGIPLYLLYNYAPLKTISYNQIICGIKCSETDLGCTIVSANYLLNNYAFKTIIKSGKNKGKLIWKIPTFNDLHQNSSNYIAKPWFILACNKSIMTKDVLIKKILDKDSLISVDLDSITEIKYNDFANELNWKEFDINNDELNSKVSGYNQRETTVFKPKFRIIIG